MSKDYLKISDHLLPGGKGKAYFHLYPGAWIEKYGDKGFLINDGMRIDFENAGIAETKEYEYAEEYDSDHAGKRIVVTFDRKLTTIFHF